MKFRYRATVGIATTAVALGTIAVLAQTPARPAATARKSAAPARAGHKFVKYNTGKMYPRDLLMTELKLSANDTEGRLTFIDEVWNPGLNVRPHFHIEHSEIFYVLSGQVEWTVAGETRLLGAGDMVYIPPDTVHGVKVVGNQDSRTLMIAEPGGHEVHLEDEQKYTPEQRKKADVVETLRSHYDFNPAEMPKRAEVSMAAPGAPVRGRGDRSVRPVQTAPYPVKHRFIMKGEGEAFSPENELSVVKLTSADTDGEFSLLDEVWQPGMKVEPHYHKGHAEVFFFLDGQVQWTVNGETKTLGAGDLLYLPPNTVHATHVVGTKPVRVLMLYNPGGYEYYWRREAQFTAEQRKQPAIQKMLREETDFNPVK